MINPIDLIPLVLVFAGLIGLLLITLCKKEYEEIAKTKGGSFYSITWELAKKRPLIGYLILGLHVGLLLLALFLAMYRFTGTL